MADFVFNIAKGAVAEKIQDSASAILVLPGFAREVDKAFGLVLPWR